MEFEELPIERRNRRAGSAVRIGYRRIIQLLVFFVLVPSALLLAVGIVLMVLRGAPYSLLFGILIVSFVSVLVTGSVLMLVFLRRAANLSQLQADFVSKVSHELRTPLTAIRLLAETMQRPATADEVRAECLTALSQEADRLTLRIERLLDWGRMEAGRKLYELREERLADVVNDAVAAFSPARNLLPNEFSVEIADAVGSVMVDRLAIIDAVVNLLSNGRKYGGSPLVLKLRVYVQKEHAVIEVTDNGAGIARSEHRRIFEKFYRIDDRLSRAREGSGLGLAIVRHVVLAHRGRVGVDSAPGRGSTFRMILPHRGGRS